MEGWRLVGGCALLVFLACGARLWGGEPASGVSLHESKYFVLRTDLPARDARRALERMEHSLQFASRYWRLRPRGRIQCYVVAAQDRWTDAELPHSFARISVGGVGGVTVSEPTSGARTARQQATIYASNDESVLEHEVVHAYCLQTFGATGPDWYKEGMAEVAAFRGDGNSGVQCPPHRLQELRGRTPKAIGHIVNMAPMTNHLSESMGQLLPAHADDGRQVPLSQWTARDSANVEQVKHDYLWSWALCYLLVHNGNYSARFRLLGDGYLVNRDDSFARMFAPVAAQLDFEYRLFLEQVEVGYRADLCAWDWDTRFRNVERGGVVKRRILAARGYQATGLAVTANRRYSYQARGEWATSAGQPATNANGCPRGLGALEGVILSDYRLGEPFVLGEEGSFVAPASGNLYLRCRDAWGQLSDNRGDMCVELVAP